MTIGMLHIIPSGRAECNSLKGVFVALKKKEGTNAQKENIVIDTIVRQGNTQYPYEMDRDEIIHSIQALIIPDHPFEVRVVHAVTHFYTKPHTASGYFENTTDLLRALGQLESYQGIYLVLNPFNPELISRARNMLNHAPKETTRDQEIVSRRWLLIDADPIRPADVSATDQEHTLALEKIHEVQQHLYRSGWSDPIIADSGNGGHLLYWIDIPTEDNTLIKRVLEGVAAQFSDEQVDIDIKVYNPSRISKIYGTWACKGVATEERPHRRAQIIKMPTTWETVPEICLNAMALPEKKTHLPRTYVHGTSQGNEAYGSKALNNEYAAVLGAPVGNRNNQLNSSAFSLGQLVGGNVLERAMVESDLYNAATSNGMGDMEAIKTIRSGLEAGLRQPRGVPEQTVSPRAIYQLYPDTPSEEEILENGDDGNNEAGGGDGDGDNHGSDGDLAGFDPDDSGNGDAMFALFGEDFLWCGSIGWFTYSGTHWKVDEEGATVKRKAVEALRRRRVAAVNIGREAVVRCTKADQGRVNGCLSRFQSLVTVNIEIFDKDPDALNCKNGVVDLRTGEVTSHTSQQRFTYCLPVAYEESNYTLWTEYQESVVGGGQEVIDYLQMAAGYSLTGHTREEIMFYMQGPTRSGKGTWAETFSALLPKPLSQQIDFTTLTAKREIDASNFDLAGLKPTRMLFASESQRGQHLNPAKIKNITGGDEVRACMKHKDFFSYRPQFKVWCLSNWPVNGDPEDDALWGRIRVIKFPNSFLGKEDKTKKARLREPETLRGILYWAVQGAIKWYNLGATGLGIPEAVAETTKEQRDDLDYVQQWLDECCEDDEEGWASHEEVSRSYIAWCDDNNVQFKKGKKGLSQSLNTKGYEAGKVKKVNGVAQRGIVGLFIRK